MEKYIKKSAVIDSTGEYRYRLGRWWGSNKSNFVNFILLNPSTADGDLDDPTVKACVALTKSQRVRYDGLVITNLFAFRATNPRVMRACPLPHGKANDKHILRVAKDAKAIVVAWGNRGTHCHRDREVLELIRPYKKKLFCLGLTKIGQPRHPLYVRRGTRFKPFRM